jgi:predicted AlkP superfamily phosphohydrolase/phosphomutase
MPRLIFLSVDGVSPEQLEHLASRMPHLRTYLSARVVRQLSSDAPPSTQALWAEFLTGSDWNENGCVGYAQPSSTLNDLKVFSEKDLQKPSLLVPDEESVISVNLPLLLPRKRIWIADGSLPLATNMSASAKKHFPGAYKPRPYSNCAAGFSNKYESIRSLIEKEIERMQMTQKLMQNSNWNRVFLRIAVFDQLQHLFGPESIEDERLAIHQSLKGYLQALDDFLHDLSATEDAEVILFSLFSHTACKARFSLNTFLIREGFLRLSGVTHREGTKRVEAFEAATSVKAGITLLNNTESRADLAHTTASSPVSGCIYLNSKADFESGSVGTDQLEPVADQLKNALQTKLLPIFKGSAKLLFARQPHETKKIPYSIVTIPGVDLCDSEQGLLDTRNVPPSCHTSVGFIVRKGAGANEKLLTKNAALMLNERS